MIRAFNYFRTGDLGGGYDLGGLNGVFNDRVRYAPPTPEEIAAEKAAAREKATQDLLSEMSHNGNRSPRNYIVRALIKEGADVEAQDKFFERTPLSIAAGYHETDIVKTLVDGGADFNKFDKYGHTPFMTACGYGYLDLVQYFLDKGVDVNRRNPAGETALLQAVHPGCRTEAVRLLLAAGAEIDAADKTGKTAFDYCREGKDSMNSYGTYNARTGTWENNRSARAVYTELERFLLDTWYAQYEKSGKPPLPKTWASTILNAAIAQGDAAIAAAALNAGANVSAPDAKGTTPLITATRNGDVAMMERLVAGGADINAQDANGTSPLMASVSPYHGAALKFLMDRNAYVDLKDKQGKTALDHAWPAISGHSELEGRPGRDIYDELKTAIEEAAKRQSLEQYQSGLRKALPAAAKITLAKAAPKPAPPPTALRLKKPGGAP